MQYLYLISCMQYCKIGVASDVENRLAQLSTGNPYPLDVLAVYEFESANAVEAALHQRFSKNRVRGEWFSLSAAEASDVGKICEMLGGMPTLKPTVVEDEIEEAEVLAEPVDGAKWDYAAMFADGWRMEKNTNGRHVGEGSRYWCWRKGSENTGKKYIYGGKLDELPYPLPDMRLIYRDGEQPLNPPNKPLALKEQSVGNE